MTKKVVKPSEFGNFDDYTIKKVDAEQRLANRFALFVNTPKGGIFVCGGSDPPVIFKNDNFNGVLVAASLKESEEALSVLREVGANVRNIFSENDFYAAIAAEFLSNYLKAVLEDLRIPVAVAAEFMAVDLFSSKVIRVFFSGDIAIDDLTATQEKYFFIGLHSKKVEDLIKKELEKYKFSEILSKPGSAIVTELEKIATILKKKFDFKYINFLA